MLKIRAEQLEALEAHERVKFENKVLAHLQEVFPEETANAEGGEEEIRGWIRDGVERAKEFGITKERDVTLFIDLDLGVALKFEKKRSMAWAYKILTDEELPGTAKIDLIYELLPQRRAKKKKRKRK